MWVRKAAISISCRSVITRMPKVQPMTFPESKLKRLSVEHESCAGQVCALYECKEKKFIYFAWKELAVLNFLRSMKVIVNILSTTLQAELCRMCKNSCAHILNAGIFGCKWMFLILRITTWQIFPWNKRVDAQRASCKRLYTTKIRTIHTLSHIEKSKSKSSFYSKKRGP